jgi:hypothetical protein
MPVMANSNSMSPRIESRRLRGPAIDWVMDTEVCLSEIGHAGKRTMDDEHSTRLDPLFAHPIYGASTALRFGRWCAPAGLELHVSPSRPRIWPRGHTTIRDGDRTYRLDVLAGVALDGSCGPLAEVVEPVDERSLTPCFGWTRPCPRAVGTTVGALPRTAVGEVPLARTPGFAAAAPDRHAGVRLDDARPGRCIVLADEATTAPVRTRF